MSFEEIHTDIQSLDQKLLENADKTISKWSNKIQSSALSKSGPRFKALNQSASTQISESLLDRDRLIRRTLVNRIDAQVPLKEDIFDDTDFYHAQLKTHIARQLVEKGNAEAASPALLNSLSLSQRRHQQKRKEHIDPHASKGRRIKYTVHDKILNFMAPTPAGTWHEEQMDELFSGLFGQRAPDNADDAEMQEEEEEIVADGLRLFA